MNISSTNAFDEIYVLVSIKLFVMQLIVPSICHCTFEERPVQHLCFKLFRASYSPMAFASAPPPLPEAPFTLVDCILAQDDKMKMQHVESNIYIYTQCHNVHCHI